MFRFKREKILPLVMETDMSIADLARASGISHKATGYAISGKPVTITTARQICAALKIDPLEYLVDEREEMRKGEGNAT